MIVDELPRRAMVRPGLRLPAFKGPFQDNGASPWYSPVRVGNGPSAPTLKLNVDTGARFNWLTSTACGTRACTMPQRRRFDPQASPSFTAGGGEPLRIDFGHWGEMLATRGSDFLGLGTLPPQRAGFYCTTHYDGTQFCELNWDGGLGVPNGLSPDPHSTHIVETLLNAGVLTPERAMVSFLMDPASGTGVVEFGGYDVQAVDEDSAIELPFAPYASQAPGLDYIWTTPLRSWKVGPVEVARGQLFCHDTGSSHFKGDPVLLMEAMHQLELQRGRFGRFPLLELGIGRHRDDGRPARLLLGADQYVTEIEAGQGRGHTTANLNPLAGYDGLVLVGSILLDHVCAVYQFQVSGTPGRYRVAPGTTLMFNKRGGPQVIRP